MFLPIGWGRHTESGHLAKADGDPMVLPGRTREMLVTARQLDWMPLVVLLGV